MTNYKNRKIAMVITNDIPESTQEKNYNTLDYLSKISKTGEVYLFDLTNLNFFKKKNHTNVDRKKLKKNIKFFIPKTFNDLKKIIENKDFFFFGFDYTNLNCLLVSVFIKFNKIKIFFFNYHGYYANVSFSKKYGFLNIIKTFINYRLCYYINRLLVILKIIPKISLYFESSQKRINQINKTLTHKIYNKYKINFLSVDKLVRINSFYSDKINIIKKKLNKNSYITIVDSGFDHKDRLNRETNITQKMRDDYYLKLFNFLSVLKIKLKLKIIFCSKPQANYIHSKYLDKIKTDFYFKSGNTEFFLENANMVIFNGRTIMLNKAIILSKKILFLKTRLMGPYRLNAIDEYSKLIDAHFVNLDYKINYSLIQKYYQFNLENKKNQNFIKDNLVFDKSKKSYQQIQKHIYEYI